MLPVVSYNCKCIKVSKVPCIKILLDHCSVYYYNQRDYSLINLHYLPNTKVQIYVEWTSPYFVMVDSPHVVVPYSPCIAINMMLLLYMDGAQNRP